MSLSEAEKIRDPIGTIESLTLGYTLLHSAAGQEIVVPNSVMASAIIIKLGSKEQ